MGNLQRSSTTGNLLKHDATGNLMKVCCCHLDYTGDILWSGTLTIDGVLQSSPTLVGVYCAPFNDGFEPGWHRASGYLWGLTPHTGFHVAHDGWEMFFQDVAWWEQYGGTSQAYQEITSFNANGCPTGTYTWILPYKAISHEQVDVYSITISEYP